MLSVKLNRVFGVLVGACAITHAAFVDLGEYAANSDSYHLSVPGPGDPDNSRSTDVVDFPGVIEAAPAAPVTFDEVVSGNSADPQRAVGVGFGSLALERAVRSTLSSDAVLAILDSLATQSVP